MLAAAVVDFTLLAVLLEQLQLAAVQVLLMIRRLQAEQQTQVVAVVEAVKVATAALAALELLLCDT
jgi:hypothetical protein